MNFSMTDYLQNRNYDLVSGASERGDTAVTNAGFLGQGKLLKAVDMADMLQQTAKIGGSATRYAGSQLGTASAVDGVADGISSLAFGAFKGGHLGGGNFGATEGINPTTVVDSFGGQASGQVGNDFFVDASGSIFPNPT